MRVTLVLPHAGMSGGIRVLAIYASALQRRGHQVFVVSTPLPAKAPPGWKASLKSLLSFENAVKTQAHSAGHFDSLSIPHRVLERERAITDADVPDADVVVATWWRTAEAVNTLSPSRGAKVYFIQHDERVFNERPEHQAAREAVERSWRLPLHRVVVAKWIADEMVRSGVAGPVGVVPNAVDAEQFHAAPRGRQPTPTVGMLYAPVRFKGCDIGFDAFELAKKSVPQLRMVCLSDPEAPPGLPDGVQFMCRPSQDRIRDVYAACDAWLFCSRSEGFGLPILEAMACRTPVIGTPAGAAPDLLPQGGGMLVPHEDPRAMADAICRVMTMPESEWVQMSEAAHRTATSYSWDDAAARFERELERAIEGNRSGAASLGALRE